DPRASCAAIRRCSGLTRTPTTRTHTAQARRRCASSATSATPVRPAAPPASTRADRSARPALRAAATRSGRPGPCPRRVAGREQLVVHLDGATDDHLLV